MITGLAWFYFGILLAMSIVTFFVYGWDKYRAKAGGRRVSERRLHLLALLGGWPGALLAQQVFRHKTQKRPFLFVFATIVGLHLLLMTALAFALLSRAT